MSNTRITFRKIATGAACGLVGFAVGGFVALAAVRYFAGSPAWELPAIICGALALFVVAVLVVAPAIGAKASNRK
jgi:hypothetical protein